MEGDRAGGGGRVESHEGRRVVEEMRRTREMPLLMSTRAASANSQHRC